jgi:hypothetical protein
MSKSIKFKNNTYLDSTSVVHNKTTLQSILNTYGSRKFLEWKSTSSSDFNSNDFITPGLYSIGHSYSNAPYSGEIYGVLMVLTNDGGIWRKTDSSSWLWQFLFTTGGSIYQRKGVNSSTPEGWTQLH